LLLTLLVGIYLTLLLPLPCKQHEQHRYLSAAKYVWEEVKNNAWDDTCGGGLWWTDKHSYSEETGYKNAITNELFIFASSQLALITGEAKYLDWGKKVWSWFLSRSVLSMLIIHR
jgi:predicted alpha-1,6-mannanase (GH76 family)